MIFGFKFGCMGLQKQGIGMGCMAKIDFRRNWISYDSRVYFSWFWVALGLIFMAFVALETGLKTDGFSGLPGGTPKLRERTSGVVTGLFQGAGLPGGTPELRERILGTLHGLFRGAGKQHSYRYHPSVLRLKSSRRYNDGSLIPLTAWWPQGAGGSFPP